MNKFTLPIVESFGPTLQGEGPYAGRLADFIRLGGCNLTCAWCDTPYSWDSRHFDLRTEIRPETVEALLSRLAPSDALVVITGGEPLLHQNKEAFAQLLGGLRELGRQIHIETNGTILPTKNVIDFVDVFVVSPKLPNAMLRTNAGDSAPAKDWPHVSTKAEVHFKYVCLDALDVEQAVKRASEVGIASANTWVMPEATDIDTFLYRWPIIADAAALHGVNASPRLHLLAWGAARGH